MGGGGGSGGVKYMGGHFHLEKQKTSGTATVTESSFPC